MSFSGFVGRNDAKLALILNAIDPRCGGVLFLGEKGAGKSTLARLFRRLLPAVSPFVELPLNATEEAVLGGVDIEKTIRSGQRCLQPGLLNRARGGFIYIDDVNLLAAEILALVCAAQDRRLESDADTIQGPTFQLLASMNLVERGLSAHLLDRFGMAVVWEPVAEPALRKEIIRQAAPALFGQLSPTVDTDRVLIGQIEQARHRLGAVAVSEMMREYIAGECLENLVAGHRGDLFLYYAARAYAAYHGKTVVTEDDVDAVVPLVLTHRRRVPPPQEDQQPPEQSPPHSRDQSDQDKDQDSPQTDQSSVPSAGQGLEASKSEDSQRQRESADREQVFDVGAPFAVRRLHFHRDRVKRGSSGRKIKTLSRDKRGRYVKSCFNGNARDIAIDATIRVAAPLQRARQAGASLRIQPEDIRYKQREKKIGHLVVFVVDVSGSMGAQRRMIETKGAIQSLLLDSYQKRDKVALIVFRKDRAELVLPPTSSVALASRCLRQIPVGGKTPLAAGLWSAHEVVRRVAHREPEMRFLVAVVTDGKANQSLTDLPPMEEVARISSRLRELTFTEFLVVDTENKKGLVQTGQARKIAADLGADYFSIDQLKADTLVSLVRSRTVVAI